MRYLNKNIDLRFLVSISLWFQQKGGCLKKYTVSYTEKDVRHIYLIRISVTKVNVFGFIDSAERVWVYMVNLRIFRYVRKNMSYSDDYIFNTDLTGLGIVVITLDLWVRSHSPTGY